MQSPFEVITTTYVPVAQMDRASACGAEGRTFESYRAYHNLNFEKHLLRVFFVALLAALLVEKA